MNYQHKRKKKWYQIEYKILPEIVATQNNPNNVFTDVVNIPFDRC